MRAAPASALAPPATATPAADPSLREAALPEALAVAAEYGLVVVSDRPEPARFALFLPSPDGRAIPARRGFEAPGLPGGAHE